MQQFPKFSDLHRVAFGSCAELFETFGKLGLTLPLRVKDDEIGVIFAADDRVLLEIDTHADLPDETVLQIAHWIVICVNTCAGFRAEVDPGSTANRWEAGHAP